jgi:hypothetical protein
MKLFSTFDETVLGEIEMYFIFLQLKLYKKKKRQFHE